MPKAYLYIRVSHVDSSSTGLSPQAQEDQARAYLVLKQREYPDLLFGGTFFDDVVSAYKLRFLQRPQGAALNLVAQPGDHIIISKVDRGFRNTVDALTTVEMWHNRGVKVHFLDIGLDLQSPLGAMMFTMLAAIAQWESARKSERNREAIAVMKSQGRAYNRTLRGFRQVKRGGKKLLVPDRGTWVIGRYAKHMSWKGICYESIGTRIEAMLAKRMGTTQLSLFDSYWSNNCGANVRRLLESLFGQEIHPQKRRKARNLEERQADRARMAGLASERQKRREKIAAQGSDRLVNEVKVMRRKRK